MFKDTKEGQTHHDKDACYKSGICGDHFVLCNNAIRCNHDLSIAQALLDSRYKDIQVNLKSMNGGHGSLRNFCNHLMVDTGKYERECKFCGLLELRAD